MMSIMSRTEKASRQLAGAWCPFWFTTEPAYTLGLIRIVFGALVILWTLEILTQLDEWFGTDGIYPTTEQKFPGWSVFEWSSSNTAILVGAIVLLVSAV